MHLKALVKKENVKHVKCITGKRSKQDDSDEESEEELDETTDDEEEEEEEEETTEPTPDTSEVRAAHIEK